MAALERNLEEERRLLGMVAVVVGKGEGRPWAIAPVGDASFGHILVMVVGLEGTPGGARDRSGRSGN